MRKTTVPFRLSRLVRSGVPAASDPVAAQTDDGRGRLQRSKTKDFEDSTGAHGPHDGHPMRAVVVTEYGGRAEAADENGSLLDGKTVIVL
jgi:hypothetical protein